jgi:hypothetical protein
MPVDAGLNSEAQFQEKVLSPILANLDPEF